MPGIRLSILADTNAIATTMKAMDRVWKFGICQSVLNSPWIVSPSTS
jgi:hypothetical protein